MTWSELEWQQKWKVLRRKKMAETIVQRMKDFFALNNSVIMV
jgi:hypothetical protein